MSAADCLSLGEVARAMTSTDALEVNAAAFRVGMTYAEAKLAAANLEAERTLLRFRVQQRLREEGAATSDKAAEQMAKDDPQYVAHCTALRDLERERDHTEILWKVLHQRAYLLSRGGTPSEGAGA